MNKNYMYYAFLQAQKAFYKGEIPVGAIIVKDEKIVAKAYNKKEILRSATRHAEIIAIEKASKKLNDWRLNDCVMYVTMEPCLMCCGAILQSRIKKIYYLVENEKFGGLIDCEELIKDKKNNHKVQIEKIEDDILNLKMKKMLKDFFIDKR